jgi:hypothetical protein
MPSHSELDGGSGGFARRTRYYKLVKRMGKACRSGWNRKMPPVNSCPVAAFMTFPSLARQPRLGFPPR